MNRWSSSATQSSVFWWPRSLYKRFPELSEGELTRLRSALVSLPSISAHVGMRLKLGKYLRLGKGEERNGGRKEKHPAGQLEGSHRRGPLYLDAGLEVRLRLRPNAKSSLPSVVELQKEHARRLQHWRSTSLRCSEYLQAQKGSQPLYVVKGRKLP